MAKCDNPEHRPHGIIVVSSFERKQKTMGDIERRKEMVSSAGRCVKSLFSANSTQSIPYSVKDRRLRKGGMAVDRTPHRCWKWSPDRVENTVDDIFR